MSGTRIAGLLQQMDYTWGQGGWFRAFQRALEGLTAEQAVWRPGPGANTIWQTVNHLAFWKGLVARRMNGAPLTGTRIRNDDTFGAPGDPADEAGWQEAVRRLYEAHAALREAIAARTDEELDRPLPDEREPLGELLNGLILHDAYHLGQILLLRKLQGSLPSRAG